ncbi:hypothetical protein ZWY2020_039785 [Hordeum vulgare]|nr:hypothetical protein ZWY2020_039785 [Hordeum vulgare]
MSETSGSSAPGSEEDGNLKEMLKHLELRDNELRRCHGGEGRGKILYWFKMEDFTHQNDSEGTTRSGGMGRNSIEVLQGRRRPRRMQVQEERNRASPARLVKLNKSLNKRKIAAMLSALCPEISENMGSFVDVIRKLDKNDVGSSGIYLHKTKRCKDAGHQETKTEEFEHDGGIPEEDAQYLPRLGSGEDEEATSSDSSSDAFVITRSPVEKQNNLREKPMASRDRGNVNMKERTASEDESIRECAKPQGHANVTHKAEKNGSPSFDLSRSFHGDEDISKDLSTPLNPCNLDAYMVESEDDWGLDPQELHKACLEAEAQFAKKKEKEKLDTEERSGNKGQINDQDASTPTIETSPVAATHVPSSSRTPAAVRNERRVVRAPAQLTSPFIDPENADSFYSSKEVCNIYDDVCQIIMLLPQQLGGG